MKKITKNNIAIALQIFAVFILFGYPGCSADNKQKNTVNNELKNKVNQTSENKREVQ